LPTTDCGYEALPTKYADFQIINKMNKENKVSNENRGNGVLANVGHHVKITDFIGESVKYDDYGGGYFWGQQKDGGQQMIAEIRGYGAIQNLFIQPDKSCDFKSADKFQDDLGRWIADAINEKLERERTQ
jgi:hypothetical protein